MLNSDCFFLRTSDQVISFTKNHNWEFMILDSIGDSLEALDVDPELKSL